MLADKDLVYPVDFYSIVWTFIGFSLLLLSFAIIFLIFFSTKKKEIKTLTNLGQKIPEKNDLRILRQKYLKMVDIVLKKYEKKEIRASVTHQYLSLIVRLFYAEASGFHAEFLTLKDLRRSKNKKLAELIRNYYPEEFNMLEKGSVVNSADNAKKLILDSEAEGDNKS